VGDVTEEHKEEIPGIGIAIWFGFLAIVIPLLPGYFGWTSSAVHIVSFVLAGVALTIGVAGAAVELRELGFFEGPSWETLGYAIVLAVIAVIFHFIAAAVSVDWLMVGLKVVATAFGVLALVFLAIALGHFLVDQRQKRSSGQVTSSSRTKAVGATAIFLLTLLAALVNLVTRVIEYYAAN